ncbi:DUF6443 domain-containing protein [Fulvivirgaceae bacterium BMA12]|uniref:DUF6443 domain-containing protein n=1 Tax=Agaribacillus aureus TaxID=3051825 RepID=A0ABT8LF26_9BACT|nr:DUF6443 domain-containing protein [Fulvivirgaceae bacterium BMA12]
MYKISKKMTLKLSNSIGYLLGITLLLLVNPTSYSQSLPVNVTITTGYDPGNNYIEAIESIRILPDFHVPSGSTFTARVRPKNEYLPTDPQDVNFVKAETILVTGKTTKAAVAGLKVEEKSVGFEYYDGLGRLMQTVAVKQSPSFEDIIVPFEYDAFGRRKKEYLPYIGNIPDGTFRANSITEQDAFYNPAVHGSFHDGVKTDNDPFSEKAFEASFLNRVSQEAAPGAAWQLNNKAMKYDYLTNLNGTVAGRERVILWGITNNLPDNLQFYASGSLLINVTTDEEGHEVREFIDKRGRTVLKKVQEAASAQINNDSHYLLTYYIYDDIGDLRFVLPPEATARLASEYTGQTALNKQNFLNRWAFQYQYDGLRRMIERRVPGAEPVYMIYDKRDRLVLTQDGNQRNSSVTSGKEWVFNKYDELNRVIMTGIYTHGSIIDRSAMQVLVNNETDQYETYNGNTGNHGYSNIVFPTTGLDIDAVTYYDKYDFVTDLTWSGYNATTAGVLSPVQGQQTGSLTKILGSSTYLKNAVYYDDKYREVEAITKNHINGKDIVKNTYDFSGRLISSQRVHSGGPEDVTTLEEYTYDHASRRQEVYHTINTGPRTLLASSSYNELGELIEKNLHSSNNGSSFLQSVDYRYNVRGWLTHINNSALSNDGTYNNDANDLFGMELIYNQATININGTNSTPQYNGNISAIKWKTDVQSGTPVERVYGYTYDPVNRLKTAKYAAKSGANWTGEAGFHDVENLGYDKNGNISTLKRYANLSGTRGTIDNLSYAYTNGNQLQNVQDTNGTDEGFKDGVSLTTEYAYDDNGNLIYDLNKNITAIRYNYLNLPREVEFSSGQKIIFTYDAAGIKLKKEVKNSDGSNIGQTDYINGFHNENGALSFLATGEGRAIKNGTDFEYDYFLTDHQGNNRLSFGWLKEKDVFKATMETENNTEESTNFVKLNTRVTSLANNHTATYEVEGTANEAARLNGFDNTAIGPGIVLENVVAGDRVSAEVFTRYSQSTSSNATVAGTMFSLVTSAFGIVNSGETAGLYAHFNNNWAATLGTITSNGSTEPKAYLNYIIFRDDLSGVPQFGFIPVTTAATTDFEKLSFEIDIPYNGDMYIYVANESNEQNLFVWFDDLKVVHQKSNWRMEVTSADDYYPFGLQMAQNAYQRESATEQRYKYNGKELQPEFGLNWHDYQARMYDASIGRWNAIDPHADSYEITNPYNYAFNNPLLFVDPTGKDNIIYLILAGDFDQNTAQKIADLANTFLEKLGLNTRVEIFDPSKNGEFDTRNLDETDNWAVIGTDREEIVRVADRINPDFISGHLESGRNPWSAANNPETSNNNRHGDGRGILIDHANSLGKRVPGLSDKEGSGLAIVHGAGHSSETIINTQSDNGEFGHTNDGIMQGGNDLLDNLKSKGLDDVLDRSNNKTFIIGMMERYGTRQANSNYSKQRDVNRRKSKIRHY